MRVQTWSITLLAACSLAACATAYQPDGISGGYSDRRVGDNTAQVSFRGDRFNSPETLHSYLLRRCAEVTQQNGFDYFVLAATGVPNPGNSSDEFTASTTIEMFKGNKPESDANAYDAEAVIRSVPTDEGDIAQTLPPPPVSIGSNRAAASPAGGVSASNANAVAAAARIPAVNPNALTNQPPSFEHF